MRKSYLLILLTCLTLLFTTVQIKADTGSETIAEEGAIIQPRFTNITVFYNDFYITDQGKAVLTSTIDARNVDECRISMYLQRYQSGSWVTVKHWTATEAGTFCGIGEQWYVMSGFQYRMMTYGYVYINGVCVENTQHTSPSILY